MITRSAASNLNCVQTVTPKVDNFIFLRDVLIEPHRGTAEKLQLLKGLPCIPATNIKCPIEHSERAPIQACVPGPRLIQSDQFRRTDGELLDAHPETTSPNVVQV